MILPPLVYPVYVSRSPIQGSGKPTARISANVNGISTFRCLMALRGSTKIKRKAESHWRLAEIRAVDLPGPLIRHLFSTTFEGSI